MAEWVIVGIWWTVMSVLFGVLIGRCISFGSGCDKGEEEC